MSETRANGQSLTVSYKYDKSERVVMERYSDGVTGTKTKSRAYDLDGNVAWETDFLGNRTEYRYDNADRQIVVINAKGERSHTQYEYNSDGYFKITSRYKNRTTLQVQNTWQDVLTETDSWVIRVLILI